MLIRLPTEILLQIVSHLKYTDQSSLMLTHSRLKQIIYHVRYANKTVHIHLAIRDHCREIEASCITRTWKKSNIGQYMENFGKPEESVISGVYQGHDVIWICGLLRFVKFLIMLSDELKRLVRGWQLELININEGYLLGFDEFWKFETDENYLYESCTEATSAELKKLVLLNLKSFGVMLVRDNEVSVTLLEWKHTLGISMWRVHEAVLELVSKLEPFDSFVQLKLCNLIDGGMISRFYDSRHGDFWLFIQSCGYSI